LQFSYFDQQFWLGVKGLRLLFASTHTTSNLPHNTVEAPKLEFEGTGLQIQNSELFDLVKVENSKISLKNSGKRLKCAKKSRNSNSIIKTRWEKNFFGFHSFFKNF